MDDRHGDPTPTGPTRFEAETSVQRVAPGEYRAEVVRSWWIVNGPNGGFVAALVLRAIVAEVDDAQRRPRSLTLHYLRAPAEGPVRIDVVVERSGRTVTNVSARMSQEGRTMVLAVAALAVDRDDAVAFDDTAGLPTMEDGTPVPMPEDVPRTEVDRDRDVPLRDHYDLRWVLGDPPFQPREHEAVARCGGWLRPAEQVPIDEVALAAMSDAWLPPVFSRHAVALAVPTVDLTIHFRSLPSDPLDFCFVEFDSPVAHAGYLVEHGRLWDRHGRLLAESRQLAVLA